MNKKFISAFMLGLLTLGATSTITSCKDYDGDISNLQGQIDKLASKDELQSKINDLQTKITAAQADATKALADAKAANDLAATKASQADLEKLQKAVADLTTELKAELAKKANQSDLETLQALVDTKADKEYVQGKLDALADKDAKLAKGLEDANKAIEAVEGKADQAIADAAANAQALADYKTEVAKTYATKGELKVATDKLAELEQNFNDKINGIDSTLAKLQKSLEDLDANVTTISSDLAGALANITLLQAEDIRLQGAIDKVAADLVKSNGEVSEAVNAFVTTEISEINNKLAAIIGAYSTMITSVDIWYNQHETGNDNHVLDFKYLSEQETTFGAGLEGEMKFTKDYFQTAGDYVVVRVNPVTADLSKLDPKNITLVNTQGKVISETLITAQKVEKFNELATATRATEIPTGLWKIYYNLESTYTADAFKAASVNKNKSILYAVAIKNADEKVDENRYVVSDYDLSLAATKMNIAAPDFMVSNGDVTKCISELRNRFKNCDGQTAIKTNTAEGKEGSAYVEDFTWADYTEPQTAENIKPVYTAADANTTKAESKVRTKADNKSTNGNYVSDDRNNKYILQVQPGKEFTITFPCKDITDHNTYYTAMTGMIKGFIVTLDKSHALESNGSELVAWKKYEPSIEGINKVITGTTGKITIKDEDAINDVIGFRVLAVNWDGTLVDPDGQAFYVKVVKDITIESGDIAAEVKTIDATAMYSGKYDLTIPSTATEVEVEEVSTTAADGVKRFFKVDTYAGDNFVQTIVNPTGEATIATAYTNATGIPNHDPSNLLLKNGDVAVNKLVVTFPKAKYYMDGATYVNKLTFKDAQGWVLKEVTITATKVMPSAALDLKFIDGQSETFYMNSTTDVASNWQVSSTTSAYVNLKNIFVDGKNYSYEVAKAEHKDSPNKYDAGKGDYTKVKTVAKSDDPILRVGYKLVDNGALAHELTAKLDLGAISESYANGKYASENTQIPDAEKNHFYQTATKNVTFNSWTKGATLTAANDYVWNYNSTSSVVKLGIPYSDLAVSANINKDVFNKTLDKLIDGTYVEITSVTDLKSATQTNNYIKPVAGELDVYQKIKSLNSDNSVKEVEGPKLYFVKDANVGDHIATTVAVGNYTKTGTVKGITFTRQQNQNDIQTPVDETFTVKFKDCFGIEVESAKIKVTLMPATSGAKVRK